MATRKDKHTAGTLSLVAEVAEVAKHRRIIGRVDVRTVTETSDEVLKTSLETGTVEVTRIPLNRHVNVAPTIRTEGDVTIIPVLEEFLFVEKRLLLKEEIHIRRITRAEEVETTVPLRRQRAVVERHRAGRTTSATPTQPSRKPKR